jgi:hypothetical protein
MYGVKEEKNVSNLLQILFELFPIIFQILTFKLNIDEYIITDTNIITLSYVLIRYLSN